MDWTYCRVTGIRVPGDFGADGKDLVALIACPLNVEIIVQNVGRTGCP